MWLEPVVTVAPTTEPVDIEEVKAALKIEATDDAALVERYIRAARSHVESRTGTRLVTQTLALRADDWSDLESLPVAPVQSVSSISYVDTDGATQTLATTVYEARLYGLSPAVVLKYNQTWPTIRSGSLITVTVVAGYGSAESVPDEIAQAMLLMVGDLYAFRETAQVGSVAGKIPTSAAVDALLANRTRFL